VLPHVLVLCGVQPDSLSILFRSCCCTYGFSGGPLWHC
jgi:hypothetical protein